MSDATARENVLKILRVATDLNFHLMVYISIMLIENDFSVLMILPPSFLFRESF